MERVIRWGVHKVLERGEHLEAPFRNKLEVAMPHIVHDVNIEDIADYCYERSLPHKDGGQHRDRKQQEINYVFRERMDHRCDGFGDN